MTITIAEDGTVIVEEATAEVLEALATLDSRVAERLRWIRDAK